MTNAPPVTTNSWSIADLRDYAEPPPVPCHPLADGAWGCLAVAAFVILCAAVLTFMRWRAKAYRRAALGLLAELEGETFDRHSTASPSLPYQVSAILKRSALVAWPREEVAGLHGQAWIDFLQKTCPAARLPQAGAELLIEGSARNGDDTLAFQQLLKFAQDWVRLHAPPPKAAEDRA